MKIHTKSFNLLQSLSGCSEKLNMFVHKQSLAVSGCFTKDNNLGYLSDVAINDLTTAIKTCEDVSYTENVYLRKVNNDIYISHASNYQPVVTRRVAKQVLKDSILYRYLVVDSNGKLIKSILIKVTKRKTNNVMNFTYTDNGFDESGLLNFFTNSKPRPKPINSPQPQLTFSKISGTVNVPELNSTNEVVVIADVANLPLGSSILVTMTNQDTAYTGNTYLPQNLFIGQGYLHDANKIAFKVNNNSDNVTDAFTINFNVIKF